MTDQIEEQTEVEVTPTVAPAAPLAFSEAPYSGNVRTRIHGYDWQLTIRAGDSHAFVEKVEGLMKWLDQRTDKALNVEPPTAPDLHSVPAPVGAPAPQTAATTVNVIHAVKLQIAPRTDGKVDLMFFEAGHQYADIKATKTPAEAAALLQPLGAYTVAHMIASEYAINANITWTPSANLNKNGKPYKNIATISAS
jgi:hypothetical protein